MNVTHGFACPLAANLFSAWLEQSTCADKIICVAFRAYALWTFLGRRQFGLPFFGMATLEERN